MLSRAVRLAAVAMLAAGAFTAVVAVSASATPETPDLTLGPCNKGWYVNPDELTRKPTPTPSGLKFEGNDLIHHAVTGSIDGMQPGTYVAAPAPDQPSFFSVEVINGDGTGYATLRWNLTGPSAGKWTMVVGGQQYENTDPAALVEMPAVKKSHQLLSFGVGYTNSPPGTVATTVSSVTFKGVTYDLKCAPPSSSSSSASASASSSSSSKPPSQSSSSKPPSASASTSSSAGLYYENCDAVRAAGKAPLMSNQPGYRDGLDSDKDGIACEDSDAGSVGSLPRTGDTLPMAMMVTGGAGAVLVGAGLLFILWHRRRRAVHFEA